MREKYKFYKKEREEQEIDIVKMMFAALSKWRLIIVFGVIGVILGLPVGIFMAKRDMLDTESLSPSIMAQLDNYAQQKELNKKLNEDDRELYVMSLDSSETYYDTKLVYTLRTDKHEDAELATKILDMSESVEILEKLAEITGYTGYIGNLSGLVSYEGEVSEKSNTSGMSYLGGGTVSNDGNNIDISSMIEKGEISEETAKELVDLLSSSDGSEDIEKLLSNMKEGKSYAVITYSISYLTKEQTETFKAWLIERVEENVAEKCSGFSGYELELTRVNSLPERSSDIEQAKQLINTNIAARETSADIAAETLIAKYATNIGASSTDDGSPAIIDSDEKELYQEYWKSITDEEYKNKISKVTVVKWMVIVGFGCAVFVMALACLVYIMKPVTVDEKILREDYNLPILGYYPTIEKKGLDKIFESKNVSIKKCSADYIADVLEKNDESKVVVVKTSADINIDRIFDKLDREVICGDIMTEEEILYKVVAEGHAVVVVKVGEISVDALEGFLQMVEYYGIVLDGVLMV